MYLLVGFLPPLYEAFKAQGADVPAWIQVARSREALVRPQGVETHWWDDMVTSDVPATFDPALDPALATRVRDLAYPYFIRMQDRVYYQKMLPRGTWMDAVNKLEMMIHFFHGLLTRNGIRTVVSSNIPHEGPHIALHFLAREMGLTNVLATQSLFPDAYWIMQDFADYGAFETSVRRPHPGFPIETNPQKPFYMNDIPLLDPMKYRLFMAATAFKIGLKAPLTALGYRRRTFRKSIFKFRERRGWYALHGLQDYAKPVPGERYVYFPLHLQPEMTTDTLGHAYCDQLLAIEELVRRLPDDVWVYLKENPKQTGRMREPSFLKRLAQIPRTRYLPIKTDSLDLIRGSEAVATVTGTAGWEALQMGKPVICFGSAWYRSLPGAFDWTPDFDYGRVEGHTFDADGLQAAFNTLCGYLRPGIVDPDYQVLKADFDEVANARTTVQGLLDFVRDIEAAKDESRERVVSAP